MRNLLAIFFTTSLSVFLLLFTATTRALPNNIKIGGLFEETNSVEEIAFKYAVDHINRKRELLPRSRVTAQIERVPPHDSFYASPRVCHTLSQGVAALFGPNSPFTAHHVQSICDAKEIPHIETRWDYRVGAIREQYSINLFPYPPTLSLAFLSLVQSLEWKDFTVLYEDNEGLVRLQELLKFKAKGGSVDVRQLLPGPGNDYRSLLKEVKKMGSRRIVLDCAAERIRDILMQAAQVGMMTAYHNYLITSLDLHMVNLDDFKYGGTNLTAFRLLDPDRDEVKQVVQDWIFGELRYGRKLEAHEQTIKGLNQTVLKTETALIYDAVHLYAQALHDLDRSQEINTKPLSCDGSETWQHGNSLVNYMKLVEMKGLTGIIKFDQHGLRTDFTLEIVELKKDGLVRVGHWVKDMESILREMTLKVIMKLLKVYKIKL